MEKGKTMDENKMTADLNYEAEYHRLCELLAKEKDENGYLRYELQNKERELNWHYGFRDAIELIFGRSANNA
jgi:hypothetical protein